MMEADDDVFDKRIPTPQDLAVMVKAWREDAKWTQATLAEICGLTERTIQRVERGEPSSFDTRRALAKGFNFTDLDVLNRPFPFPDADKLKTFLGELERTTVSVCLTRIDGAKSARQLVEGAESSVSEIIGEPSEAAKEAFAAFVDHLRDYNDLRGMYGEVQRMEFDRFLEPFLEIVSDQCASVAIGIRRVKVGFKNDPPDKSPMNWMNVYFILATNGSLPAEIRVSREFSIA